MPSEKTKTFRVNPGKCQGHSRCYAIAPELFELDEFGSAKAKGDGHILPALEEKLWLARSNCPEIAIEIIDE